MPLDALRADAEIAAGADQNFFQAAHKLYGADFGLEAAQIEDRIGDELAGTMEGDVAAAIDFVQLDTALRQELRRGQHVVQTGIASERDDRRMLQQQQRVLDAAGFAQLEQRALEIERRSSTEPGRDGGRE